MGWRKERGFGMNNIVIVEDNLAKGISLAEQFEELASENKEFNLHVLAVCYFKPDSESAQKDIAVAGKHDFDIEHVTLWDMDKRLNDYMDSNQQAAIVIMDYMLDGDGSEGIPMHRASVRYARGLDKNKANQLWLYTGTGTANYNILCQLVGREHVLNVRESRMDYLRLSLDDEKFKNALKADMPVRV